MSDRTLAIVSTLYNHHDPKTHRTLSPAYPVNRPEDKVLFKHLTDSLHVVDSDESRRLLTILADVHNVKITWVED